MPVQSVDKKIRNLAKDMLQTMYHDNGIGLAAVQVGILKRIITIDISDTRDEPLFLINPQITYREGEIVWQEGCLSVPQFFEKVTRSKIIKVRAQNLKGREINFQADGLLAVCIQHEIDHLDGKLFIDYLSVFGQAEFQNHLKATTLQEETSS